MTQVESGDEAVAKLALDRVTKVYPDGTHAVDRLDLAIADGELLVLLGPSGCGKSTVLRMIAGLESITSGELHIEGVRANDIPPQERALAMVFQSYALYPHLSARDNVGFPLSLMRMSPLYIDRMVREVAAMLDLGERLDRRPQQLSGGERQRVAMGRAMVRRPRAFLMDEPLSNLDIQLRTHVRAEICTLIRHFGVTTVYVTHDQTEAMSVGDRVAILDGGVLQQVGTPQEVYDEPANAFVAAFVGSPQMNLLEAVVQARADGAVELNLGTQSLTLLPPLAPDHALLRGYDGQRVVVGLRAEALGVPPEDPLDAWRWQTLRGATCHVEYLGHATLVHLVTGSRRTGAPRIALPVDDGSGRARRPFRSLRGGPGRRARDGAADRVADDERANPAGDLVAWLPPTLQPRIGSVVTLTVDLARMYVFDRHGRRLASSTLARTRR
jgi:multiple sugar transport system ATP-binding protein